MIDLTRSRAGDLRRAAVVLAALAAGSLAGCGGGGLGPGRPVSKPEDVISGKATLVDQKTGEAGESPVPPDYGPPAKRR